MKWTTEELKQRIAVLPEHIKDDIIYAMTWDVFGDLDDHEDGYIDTDRKPDPSELRITCRYLGTQLIMERPALTVKEVIRSGELEIEPGHTIDEIIELACESLNTVNAWDICGEIMFLGTDERYYVGNVEFVITPANPAIVKMALAKDKNDQGGDDEEPE